MEPQKRKQVATKASSFDKFIAAVRLALRKSGKSPDFVYFLGIQPENTFNLNEPQFCCVYRGNSRVLRTHFHIAAPDTIQDIIKVDDLVGKLEEAFKPHEWQEMINISLQPLLRRAKDTVKMQDTKIYFISFTQESPVTEMHKWFFARPDIFDLANCDALYTAPSGFGQFPEFVAYVITLKKHEAEQAQLEDEDIDIQLDVDDSDELKQFIENFKLSDFKLK